MAPSTSDSPSDSLRRSLDRFEKMIRDGLAKNDIEERFIYFYLPNMVSKIQTDNDY
jgi:hypothetical protein